jgi:UDP-2,4-diacetamido-2,4,6-trideoxy-beta-L-altropyranose hydrolase
MKIAIRVDASVDIGTGHLVRCITLANALKPHADEIRFLCRFIPEHFEVLLNNLNIDLVKFPETTQNENLKEVPHSHWLGVSQRTDANESLSALSDKNWDWLIVDHYSLDERWEKELRGSTKKIMVIDDIADRRHDCDLLLDQNLSLDDTSRYVNKIPDYCAQLVGPRYALLREEFQKSRHHLKPNAATVKRLLVFFGGIDSENNTEKAIIAIQNLDITDITVDVVIGSRHPACAAIKLMCQKAGFSLHVQVENIAELMAAADLSIGAGGIALWERCCLGLPSLIFCCAENQSDQIKFAANRGLIYALDNQTVTTSIIQRHVLCLMENSHLRQNLSEVGMTYVDGKGASRVILAMGFHGIEFRVTNEGDSEAIFGWRNDASNRMVSRSNHLINKKEHDDWFSSMLLNENKILLIAQNDNKAVGVVRFDIDHKMAEISIYLVPGLNRTGTGSAILLAAESWLRNNRTDVETINAHVMDENERSKRLFTGCNYKTQSLFLSKKITNII